MFNKDEKSYSDNESNRIYADRKRWLWNILNRAQQAYQQLTRMPHDKDEAIAQEKFVQTDLDQIRVAAYQAQENLKHEEL